MSAPQGMDDVVPPFSPVEGGKDDIVRGSRGRPLVDTAGDVALAEAIARPLNREVAFSRAPGPAQAVDAMTPDEAFRYGMHRGYNTGYLARKEHARVFALVDRTELNERRERLRGALRNLDDPAMRERLVMELPA